MVQRRGIRGTYSGPRRLGNAHTEFFPKAIERKEGHPIREWPSIVSLVPSYGFFPKSTVGASFAAAFVTSK